MRQKFYLTVLLTGFIFTSYGQPSPDWDNWKWLKGEWHGKGSGQTGQGGGFFSFTLKLDNKILERKSHSEYPATAGRPLIVHEDLMIIYPDQSGIPSGAVYFDNEGHVINYVVSYPGNSIVLTSGKIKNMPVFRLTYSCIDSLTVNTRFEVSQDGENFTTYVEGISKKIR